MTVTKKFERVELTRALDDRREALDRLKAAKTRCEARVEGFIQNARSKIRRILIVEDNPDQAFMLRELLERDLPARYDVVDSALGAIALLRCRPYALVLIDYFLAGEGDGLWLIQEIRRQSLRPLMPIIAMSGAVDEMRGRDAAAVAGANAFLVKPIHHEELLHVVHSLLDHVASTSDRR